MAGAPKSVHLILLAELKFLLASCCTFTVGWECWHRVCFLDGLFYSLSFERSSLNGMTRRIVGFECAI